MNDERELERHNNIVEKIRNAKTRDDLPNVSFSTITSFLANNVYFNKQKISQIEFKTLVDELIHYGSIEHPNVRNAFIKIILTNYPNVKEEEIIEKYNFVVKSKRIKYVLYEIRLKIEKLDEINKRENLEVHKDVMKKINHAYDVKDLPKVGLSELNKRLLRAVNDNDFNSKIKTSEIKELTDAYLSDLKFSEKETIIKKICSKESISDEDKVLMKEQIIGSLIMDETIEYIVEEINTKEARKLFIYKNDHEITMDSIKDAHRISQLPSNLTISTLTSYLNGNTTIYANDDRIKSEDFKKLTELLLDGYKWEDEVIIKELKQITENKYPDKNDAFELLFNKLSKLPKIYYYVEEINFSLSRQKEFIGNNCSNVNVYFIPNGKSPIDGGRFYNCYINRVQNLDLSKILPLDLNEIVPPSMDIDSVEWYVQENYDDTFKTAGGIILNKDETIGNVNVFRPNDGTVGITLEEKKKMDEISDLDKKIEEKQQKLASIDNELIKKEKKSLDVEDKMKELVQAYEQKAIALQMELLKSISELKKGLGYVDEFINYDEKGKGIK